MTWFDNSEEKASKAVSKILRQTQEGELIWETDTRKIPLGAEEYIIGKAYRTNVLNKIIRIFKFKYKDWTDVDEFNWSEGYRLQFTDWDGNPEWEFPITSRVIVDLYDAVCFQTSEVKEFFDKWLSE